MTKRELQERVAGLEDALADVRDLINTGDADEAIALIDDVLGLKDEADDSTDEDDDDTPEEQTEEA